MPTFRSMSTAVNGAATSLTITKPAGVASGDVLVAALTVFNATITTPSGWTLLTGAPVTLEVGTGSFRRLYVFHKLAATEGASYAFSLSQSTQVSGGIAAYSGAATSYLHASNVGSSDGDGTTVATGSITPTVNGCTVVSMFGTDVYNANAPATWSIPSTTKRFDVADTSTFMTTALADEAQATAAAVSRTGTISGLAPCRLAAIIALAPPSGPPPPPPGTVVIPVAERDAMVDDMEAQIASLTATISDMTDTRDALAAFPVT